MQSRKLILVVLAGAALVVAGVAIATPPSGLVGTPLARGGPGEFRIHDRSERLRFDAREPTDVALVKATLAADGFTGWHAHAGPSLVIVKAGELTMHEPGRRSCQAQTFRTGEAFVHPEGVHNFVAGPEGAEFYIVYFVPTGASPAAIDIDPAPRECALG